MIEAFNTGQVAHDTTGNWKGAEEMDEHNEVDPDMVVVQTVSMIPLTQASICIDQDLSHHL